MVALGAATSSAAADDKVKQQSAAEQNRLSLDRDRLAFDKDLGDRRLASDKDLGERRLRLDSEKYLRDYDLEKQKALWATVSVSIPLLLAVLAYLFQVYARKRDEALQFELKAAEIVMNARDANEARKKAQAMTQMFPHRLPALETALVKSEKEPFPYFGPAVEVREELLKVLAEHPESRREIIRAWQIMFPWHSADTNWDTKTNEQKNAYKWFDELKRDETVNRNVPAGSDVQGR
jgi:hypothetical protein